MPAGDEQGMTPERTAARKAKLASWLRQGLIRLGPTFIKIGQQFSTRVDVLAPEFVKVLLRLTHPICICDPVSAMHTTRLDVPEARLASCPYQLHFLRSALSWAAVQACNAVWSRPGDSGRGCACSFGSLHRHARL